MVTATQASPAAKARAPSPSGKVVAHSLCPSQAAKLQSMVDGRVVELDFDAAGTLVTFFSETFHDSDITGCSRPYTGDSNELVMTLVEMDLVFYWRIDKDVWNGRLKDLKVCC